MKKITAVLAILIVLGLSVASGQSVYVVTTTADAGSGTLRQAVIDANGSPGADTIKFNIPFSGVQTIALSSALPVVTDPVVIDGYTQPGASPNTLAVGNNAVLLIELNGQNSVPQSFLIKSGSSKVRGLVLNRFSNAGIDVESDNNTVAGNFIGTDPGGNLGRGNASDGVFIANGPFPGTGNFNLIGGNTPADRNIISGNGRNGMTFDQTVGSQVSGNYIGTNAAGTAPLANAGAGIGIFIGSGHVIGGPTSAYRNIISGNANAGIEVNSTNGNSVLSNYIGVNAAGTTAIGNGSHGVTVASGSGTAIGTIIGAPGAGNVISGNGQLGIFVNGPASQNTLIQANFIGVNASGSSAIPNLLGVQVSGATNTFVGTSTSGARNIISGNALSGIEVIASGTTVQGNFIGTNVAGNAAIPNGPAGGGSWPAVYIHDAPSNTLIGGGTPGARNIISGNIGDGVSIWQASTSGVTVRGNYIGVQADGTSPLGNTAPSGSSSGAGVAVRNFSTNITVGGLAPGEGNIIANNAFTGIVAFSGTGISILNNSIYSNTGLGIDLGGQGVGNPGVNGNIKFPVLTSTEFEEGGVSGYLSGLPNASYRLQLFRNATADSSGYGEGRFFLKDTVLTTSDTGKAVFFMPIPGLSIGDLLSATATDPNNNTSEFSADVVITPKFKAYGNHFVVNTTLSGIPLHWPDGKASFFISAGMPPAFVPAMDTAFATWRNAPPAQFTEGGITPSTLWGGDPDGINNNVYVTSGWQALTGTDPATIALTRVRYNSLTGEITDADIAYNAQQFTFGNVLPAGPLDVMDMQNVATHEAGHVLGLADIYNSTYPAWVPLMGTANESVTMYGLINAGEINKRVLHSPDIAGINYIFANVPASRIDMMLVIDGSASYSTTYNALVPSKNSAVELVQRMRDGDRLGIVKMPNTVVYPLTTLSPVTRVTATTAINALTAGGTSAIGTGLQTAQTLLNSSPVANHSSAMILFSAGEESGSPGALQSLPPLIAGKSHVYTLGFPGSSGQTLDNKIADSTGGAYYLAADTTIAQIVNQIWDNLTGVQTIYKTVVSSDTFNGAPSVKWQGANLPSVKWQGAVDPGTSSILPSVKWQGSKFVFRLHPPPPDTTVIDSAYAASHPALGIKFFAGPTFAYFQVPFPAPGIWQLEVGRQIAPLQPEPLVISIEALNDLTMAIGFDKAQYKTADHINVQATLSRGGQTAPGDHVVGGGPVTDAIVKAYVKIPNITAPEIVSLTHVGNGVYKGTFGTTTNSGSYGFTFIGTAAGATRQVQQSVLVAGSYDTSSVVFATNSVLLKGLSRIVSGNVIVNNKRTTPGGPELQIEELTLTPPNYALKARTIIIKPLTLIQSNVYYQTLTNRGKITGSLHPNLILPVVPTLPPFQVASTGGSDVTVNAGQTITLAPGSYRNILVQLGGKLKFSGGVYNINKLEGKNKARFMFAASSDVRIATTWTLADLAYIGPANNQLDASGIIIYVGGSSTSAPIVQFGVLDSVLANFYAPFGRLTMKEGCRATGAFLAQDVTVEELCFLTLKSYWARLARTTLPKEGVEPEDAPQVPVTFSLEQNYPNPFNPSTTIRYRLAEPREVTLTVYNVIGQVVKTLVKDLQQPGTYEIKWEGSNDNGTMVSSGVYFYRLKAGDFVDNKKMLFLK